MPVNSLIILGSSSGLPQAERATSGYLLKTNRSNTLIDCGGGVTSSFLKAGLNPLSVDRIFISHTHSDHVCEITLFIQLIYLNGRTNPLELYLPSEFVNPFEHYLNAVYLLKEKLPFELEIIGYESGFQFDKGFKLNAYQTSHLQKYKEHIAELGLPNKMQCHCFMIDIDGCRILYSADIGSLSDVEKYFDGCRYVIIESTHINIDEFLQIAPIRKVHKYVITHLGGPEEVARIREAIAKSRLSNVVIAEDRMELAL